ncbi:MAG: hypothetical protein ABFS35_21835 [Bacteroidota bacterium]
MLKVKKYLIVSIFLLSVFSVPAQQTKSLSQLVKETMELRRQGNYWKGLSPFRHFIKDSSTAMIREFEPYTNDSLENIRSFAYNAIAISGYKSTNSITRRNAVYILVTGCTDNEAALRKNIAGQLDNFQKKDFTSAAKQKLAKLLNMEETYYRHTVKLIGFLNMKDQIPVLNQMIDSGKVSNRTLIWDFHLTLARLGVQNEIDYCVSLVKSKIINDNVIYNLFPDLVYIRSKEAVDYMVEVLLSDSKNCYSPNPDNPVKILCGYRVMEYLAPIIKDFPLEVDRDGELDIDDYEAGLVICRNWFKQHIDDYEIDDSKY